MEEQEVIPKEVEIVDVKYLILLLIVCFVYSCVSEKASLTSNNNHYKIIRDQSKNGSSAYIAINSFDNNNRQQELPAYYRVNNIIFPNIKNPGKRFILPVKPGIFNIEAGWIGKKETEINSLKVEKGDSVLIKIYLQDETEPLHPSYK